jgi:agmatinase
VRDASQYVKPYHLEHGVNVAEALRCCDAGDAAVKPYSIKETLESVKAWVVATARGAGEGSAKPAKMLAIGGDHSIAYACIAAARELHSPGKPLALIHLDSHLDTVDSVWGEQWGHASPFRRLIDDGIVDAGAMLSIGVKGPLNTAADLEYARERNVTLVTHAEYQRNGPEVLRKFISRLRERPVYVTFDIDVVDPAFAPGTGTPSVGGFTSAEALAILRSLKGINLAGADVVEVLPDRDVSQITAMLAAHVAFEILALDASARGVGI